jgi:hypothetical protein
MPPDSLVLNSNIVQGGTNAKPENVISHLRNDLVTIVEVHPMTDIKLTIFF